MTSLRYRHRAASLVMAKAARFSILAAIARCAHPISLYCGMISSSDAPLHCHILCEADLFSRHFSCTTDITMGINLYLCSTSTRHLVAFAARYRLDAASARLRLCRDNASLSMLSLSKHRRVNGGQTRHVKLSKLVTGRDNGVGQHLCGRRVIIE